MDEKPEYLKVPEVQVLCASGVPRHSPPGPVGQVITAARATPLHARNATITVNKNIALRIIVSLLEVLEAGPLADPSHRADVAPKICLRYSII
jgi:hypothetical protein